MQNAQTAERNGRTGQIMHNVLSQDANYNCEVQSVVTSRFARQTGSVSIFQPLIDLSLFSQEGVIRDAEQNGPKCRRLVLLAKQEVPDIFTPFIDEFYMLGIWL